MKILVIKTLKNEIYDKVLLGLDTVGSKKKPHVLFHGRRNKLPSLSNLLEMNAFDLFKILYPTGQVVHPQEYELSCQMSFFLKEKILFVYTSHHSSSFRKISQGTCLVKDLSETWKKQDLEKIVFLYRRNGFMQLKNDKKTVEDLIERLWIKGVTAKSYAVNNNLEWDSIVKDNSIWE